MPRHGAGAVRTPAREGGPAPPWRPVPARARAPPRSGARPATRGTERRAGPRPPLADARPGSVPCVARARRAPRRRALGLAPRLLGHLREGEVRPVPAQVDQQPIVGGRILGEPVERTHQPTPLRRARELTGLRGARRPTEKGLAPALELEAHPWLLQRGPARTPRVDHDAPQGSTLSFGDLLR